MLWCLSAWCPAACVASALSHNGGSASLEQKQCPSCGEALWWASRAGTPTRPRKPHTSLRPGSWGTTRRPMFNEVLPLAQHTCNLAPRLFWNAREGVALGARPRENNDSLLLASNGTTSRLLHQEEHSLAVLVLAGGDFLFVGSKVCVVHR